jgi:hypothetical protein
MNAYTPEKKNTIIEVKGRRRSLFFEELIEICILKTLITNKK